MTKRILLLVLLGLPASGACSGETDMIDRAGQVRAVTDAAISDYEWNPGDVSVGSVERLDHGGCTFYRATNTAQLDRLPAEYAVLPDGQVVGGSRSDQAGSAAAAVLMACGRDAPAEWWAAVVTRLSGQVTGILVDPEYAPSAVRKIREAGGEYTPPALTTDADSTTITFYTIDYETSVPYENRALLSGDGKLEIDRRELVPDSRGG